MSERVYDRGVTSPLVGKPRRGPRLWGWWWALSRSPEVGCVDGWTCLDVDGDGDGYCVNATCPW